VCFDPFGGPHDQEPSASAGPGCYAAAVAGGVRAGRTFALRIELPNGELVEGETVAPERLSIREPVDGTAVPLEQASPGDPFPETDLAVAWTAPAAAIARLYLAPDAVFRGGEAVPDARCSAPAHMDERRDVVDPAAADTFRTRLTILSPTCRVPDSLGTTVLDGWDSLRVRLRVTAFDSTFAAYHEHVLSGGSSVSADYASAGIEGAVGVFAGAAIAERRITLIATEHEEARRTPGRTPEASATRPDG
ncbi:MAG: hypothetical protein ACOC8B_07370, partial [Gemmatimonadota bacterium]